MAVEISDIREGLATNLKTIGETRQVSAYPLDSVTPPALLVMGFDKIQKIAMGSYSIGFLIQGLAGKPTQKGAHIRLDKWLSPLGTLNVWSAIECDKTLGGKVSSLNVVECDGYQMITVAPGVEYLGSTWHVQIEL